MEWDVEYGMGMPEIQYSSASSKACNSNVYCPGLYIKMFGYALIRLGILLQNFTLGYLIDGQY